jgi:hypothetical protein
VLMILMPIGYSLPLLLYAAEVRAIDCVLRSVIDWFLSRLQRNLITLNYMYALVSIYKMHVMFTKSHYALGSFSLPVNQPHPPLLGVSLGHDEDTRDFCNQNLGSSIFFKKMN